jgi:DNA-binding GntR family transcriptional regulator
VATSVRRRAGLAAAAASSAAHAERLVLPMPRQTVASLTLDALRARILGGDVPDGEPLRQDAVAEALGVSRIPVREALRQLEAEGLVTFVPHRGAVVATLSPAEIEEIFALRAQIESELLRRAIPRTTAVHLARAEQVLDAYELALRGGEVSAWGALNWQLHSALYAPAERSVTLGVLQRLHQQSDRYIRLQLAATHGEARANREHRAIVAAVRRKDVRRAAQLLQNHILGAGRALLSFLETPRTSGAAARKRGARA